MAHISLQHIFNWRWFSFHRFSGWMIVVANIFNALAASISLMVVVRAENASLADYMVSSIWDAEKSIL